MYYPDLTTCVAILLDLLRAGCNWINHGPLFATDHACSLVNHVELSLVDNSYENMLKCL